MGSTKIRSVYRATEAQFAVDPSANGALYQFIHAADVAPSPSFGESIDRTVQNDTLDHPGTIIGAQGGTLGFKAELRGPGSTLAADDTKTASHGEVGEALEAIFGSARKGQGTTFTGTWTSTGGKSKGQLASMTGVQVGDILYRVNSKGRVEARPVVTKTTDIEVSPPWSEIPTAASKCYAMVNYIASNSGQKTESYVVKGDDFEWLLQGLMGTVQLEALTARGLGMLGFTYQVDRVNHKSTKASLPAAADAFPNPPVAVRAPCWINGVQTMITEFSFDLGNDVQPKLATEGDQGRYGWAVVGQARAASAKVYYSADVIDLYQAGTKFPVFFFVENGPGNVMAVYIPAAQIVADPSLEDNAGQNGQTLALRATKPASGPSFVLAIG